MLRLAIVRGASEGDLLRRKAKIIRRAAFDNGKTLEGLDGGAGKDRAINVAGRCDQPAL